MSQAAAKTLDHSNSELPRIFPGSLQTKDRDSLRIARETLRLEATVLQDIADLLDSSFDQAVEMLANCRGIVIATGMGKAGLVAQKIAATFSSTGTRSHFVHPGEAAHGDLGMIGSDDVVLTFSHSGESRELTEILPSIQLIGCKIIGVTSRGNSTLAKASSVAIVYGNIEEACPIGLAPSSSTTAMMALGDSIAFCLMQKRKFEKEDFAKVHPAGSLGKKLKPVREMMRTGDRLRVASQNHTVREVFVEAKKPGRRTGALILIDEQGNMTGLFTDSDLARLIEAGKWDAFDRPISDYMTKNPVSLHCDDLVHDAVEILKSRHLSEIPVIDDSGKPAGMIDITDLMDLLPEAV